ncbi:MAG TPA: carboxyl transferase domain-containing protein [Conexibacter sp.]|nr:carboxyl transferase domain-containing protein [Conexibacter sp.]
MTSGPASARERVALVADADSFEEWDADVASDDPLSFRDTRSYADRLDEARAATGLSEAVLTGRATLDGRPLVVVAGEFGFLGGSIGVATAERVARAFERALEARLPLVALTASGGSRMQEGTLAVVGMAKLADAAGRLRAAGLPYVVCLTHPTLGGVLASWGSLGTVTFALPGALAGFAGPRVVELLTGRPLSPRVQRSETLLAHGLVDGIVAPDALRSRVAAVLAVAAPRSAPAAASPGAIAADREWEGAPSPARPAPAVRGSADSPAALAPADAAGSLPLDAHPTAVAPTDPAGAERRDAWASLQHVRDRRRPGAGAVLDALAEDVTVLRGARDGHPDDPACFAALARVVGVPAVVVAQRRRGDGAPAVMNPSGYRKARRAMALAAELRLPLVTIVDTPGAELSADAERGGLAGQIAGCLADMAALPVPTVAVLLGEGGSGGALALLLADRVLAAEHASLGVIAPEGASAILYRDLDHAAELAAAQGGASWHLVAAGIADAVIPESRPAHEEPEAFVHHVGAALSAALAATIAADPSTRLAGRHRRWRSIGAAQPPTPQK